MPAPLPDALRQRAVDAYLREEGSYKEIAERFDVSHGSLESWVQRFRSTGSVSASAWRQRGREPLLDASKQEQLRQLVEANNDATLAELQQALRKQGTKVSVPTLSKTLVHKLKLTRKKKTSTPVSETDPTTKPSGKPSSRPSPKRRVQVSTSSTRPARTRA